MDGTVPPTWAEAEFGYLTTTGRRSGRRHQIEIWFAVHDDRLYLIAGGGERSDWVRNLRAEPAVAFRVENTAVQGSYAVAEVMEALRALDADPEVEVIIIARAAARWRTCCRSSSARA